MNRISDEQVFFELFPEPELIRDLKDIFEDYRIESRLRAIYPVLGRDILRMNRHMLKARAGLDALSNDKERAVEAACQMLLANRTKEAVPENISPVLQYAVEISASLNTSAADVHDSFRAAAALYKVIDEAYEDSYSTIEPFSSPIDQAEFNDNIGNFSRTAENIIESTMDIDLDENDPESSPDEESADSLRPDPSEREDTGNDNGEENPSAAEISVEDLKQLLLKLFKEKKIRPKDIEEKIVKLDPSEILEYIKNLETAAPDEKEKIKEPGSFLYPEWGNDINAYRANWTTVIEQTVTGDDPEFYRETMEEYGGLVKKIRREFQVLRPQALMKLRRQFDGDNIDFDAAIDYQIDLILNITPSEKNYIKTLKRTRDIAVAFLIDLSGSTSGNTIKCEKQSIVMLSEALNELKDTFAIYGFTGYSRDKVDFYIVKDFEENYNERIKQRISGLTADANTREGAAIRHVTSKLRIREEKTRILILLNDSQPFDEGYTGDYAIADTRMALYEAKKYGIKPFCLTITKNSRNLKELYSHNSWVVIDDICKLPERITKIYRKLTT